MPPSDAAASVVVSARPRALARLRRVIVVALALPAILFAGVVWYLYQQAFSDARQTLDGVARIAQEHALKLLETNEMLLQRMLDLLGDADDSTLLARGAAIHERLEGMAKGIPQLQGLFVNGADARMLASSSDIYSLLELASAAPLPRIAITGFACCPSVADGHATTAPPSAT